MLCVRGFDKIVVLSKDAQRYYSHFLPVKKLCISYNTRILDKEDLEQSEIDKLLSFKANDILIGVNALLTKRKGIDQLIRVLPKLSGYKLFIVGEGKECYNLKQLAIEQGVEERVYFAGYINNAYRFLQYYDIFAIPSRSEGFPLSLIEAAIMHKKVVASNIPIFKEIFSEKEVSFFDLENMDSLRDAIIDATQNESMAENIYGRFENDYSPEIFYQNYLSIYHGKI